MRAISGDEYEESARYKSAAGIKEIEIRKELKYLLEMRTRLIQGLFIYDIDNSDEAREYIKSVITYTEDKIKKVLEL